MTSGKVDSAWFGKEAYSSLRRLWNIQSVRTLPPAPILPETSPDRLTTDKEETILYLAYGSNLCAETFRGKRGIKPISSVNVHAPTIALTFDLSGVPYIEPCFANTRYRDISTSNPQSHKSDYHKDRWHKGLIGVVYEVTHEDYRTIIATEGGGAGYQDVLVPCYVLADDPIVSPTPSGSPFKVHTLLQPRINSVIGASKPGAVKDIGRIQRPDPSYAQPSARYLKLITDGAEEHSLPSEYLAFLYNIRPFTITTFSQRLGQVIFVALWGPIVITIVVLGRVLADDEGKIPKKVASVLGVIFKLVWGSYDVFFKKTFGDGERTIEKSSGSEAKGNISGKASKVVEPEWPEEKKRDL